MFVPVIEPQTALTLVPGVIYGQAGDVRLPMDLVLPQDTGTRLRPAVVWIAANWVNGSRTHATGYWCAHLAARGIVAAAPDFRLCGAAFFPAQIHDIKAAIRWLRKNAASYRIDADRIGIAGFSGAGHLAALAALTGDLPALEGTSGSPDVSTRVRAAAIASANTDFLNTDGIDPDGTVFTPIFGGSRAVCEDLMRLASPTTHAHPGAPPLLIVHGTLDETVPFNQAKRLHNALVRAGGTAELIPIDGGYHNWNPHPEATWPKVRYFEFAELAVRFFQHHL